MSATATEPGTDAQAAEGNGSGGEAVSRDSVDEARKSLDELAGQEPDEEGEQYTLFGTAPKLNNKVGGPRVTSAAVRFTAKRSPLPGQFDLNDTVRGTFVGRVKDLQFPTKANTDGSYEVTRVHVVELERLSQAEDVPEEFAQLDGRGRSEADGEVERLQARVRELEELLEGGPRS